MDYLEVKNWEEYQHYKDRCPPWIKLSRDLLNDYEFSCLQDASKLHLILIWLLASQMDNKIPADANFIRGRIGIKGEVNLRDLIDNGFLIDASNALAGCKQVAIAETETEAYSKEAETEREEAKTEWKLKLNDAVEIYNVMAENKKLPLCQKLTSARVSKLKKRLIDCGGLEGWAAAIEKVSSSGFCTGKNDKGWRADIDFIIKEASFTKIMEGKYDDRAKVNQRTENNRQGLQEWVEQS